MSFNANTTGRGRDRKNQGLEPKRYDIKIRGPRVLVLWLMAIIIPGMAGAAPSPEEMAQAPWYQVELIVFSHLNRSAREDEQWPEVTGIKLADEALIDLSSPEKISLADLAIQPLVTPDTPPANRIEGPDPRAGSTSQESGDPRAWLPTPYEILDASDMQMADVVERLRRSRGFRPLLHVAWRQPTFERDRAVAVVIHDGVKEVQDTDQSPRDIGLESGSADKLSRGTRYPSETDLAIGALNPRFVGTVKLSVSRYLHLDANLFYRDIVQLHEAIRVPDYSLWELQPYPSLKESQGPAYRVHTWRAVRAYQLKESRRMRSTEVHYIDHPVFGIVVLATPYELPIPPAKDTHLDPNNIL